MFLVCVGLFSAGVLWGTALPETVTLKNEVTLALMMNGQAVGSMQVRPGKEVKLIRQVEGHLEISVGAAWGTVAVADTDFESKLAELRARENQPAAVPSAPDEKSVAKINPEPQAEPAAEAQSMELDVVAEPRPGSYDVAEFRLWHPDIRQEPRAVLVLVPGFNGDGRRMARDQAWQAIAREFNWLIIACRFKEGNYQNPEAGSGAALFDAIESMGKEVKQRGLEDLPLVMWGISAGGQFNYNFAQWKPEQVLTFVVNKGAYYTAHRNKKAQEVPALFFIGMKDKEIRIKNINGIFLEGREKNAPWALIREPNQGHGAGASKEFSRAYFRTIFPMRLPDGQDKLQEVKLDQGYLGHLKTYQIVEAGSEDWDTEDSTWLPTQELVHQWCQIVNP
ncbi:MAG: hypothetical protein AAF649_10905 [Verrucomicrobiota bacterium]